MAPSVQAARTAAAAPAERKHRPAPGEGQDLGPSTVPAA